MSDELKKNAAIINKTEKKIGPSGDSYDYKNLTVQADTMDECKKVFDEVWNE